MADPTLDDKEPPIGVKLFLKEIKPRLDAGKDAAAIAAELGVDEDYVEDLVRSWTTPHATATGPELFADVKAAMAAHYYLEEPWHYVVAALFVLQARVSEILPVVFYLFIGGAFGSGKTNFLNLVRHLTSGLFFENVSIAALARTMSHGRTVCMDEIDVDRGKDFNEIRDAFLRQGYKADAAPYVRWDASKKAKEEIPVYGPRAAAYRGLLEDALQSRGFMLPSVKSKGPEGYEYVLRNFWPEIEDLPVRLETWGQEARAAFPPDKLKAIAWSESFREKVSMAVDELGANRDSELATIALLVAEMAGIDVLAELKAANKLREIATFSASSDDVEELGEVVSQLAGQAKVELFEKAETVRLRQVNVRRELNRRRRERGEKVVGDKAFAKLRRAIDVPDTWLVHGPTGGLVWSLPLPWLSSLSASVSLHMERTEPTEPTEAIGADGTIETSGNRILGPLDGPHHPCDACGAPAAWKIGAGIWLKASCDPCLAKYGLTSPGGAP